jgi:hemoglobin
MDHFGRWLNIWFETVDANFKGQKAELAKSRARNMSTMLYMKMYEARK